MHTKIKRILIAFSFLTLFIGTAHALVFPQETRCILIDFYDFEKDGNLYFRADVDAATIADLQQKISKANARVEKFWKGKIVAPKYIYCQNNEDYKKFGVPFMTPACAHMKLGSYVVISNKGNDVHILAHEISHTVLFNKIGFFNRVLKIPVWFDEGLAMQVDWREYYSIDSLKEQSENFKNLPDVKQLTTYSQFGSGTRERIMLNYSTSKYVVNEWYSEEKLENFIQKINEGKSFEEAYSED